MDSSRKAIVQQTQMGQISSPQANFNNPQFVDFINDKGYAVEIERAVKCPCYVNQTGNPVSTCMNCGGSGWFYIDLQKSVVLCSSMANRTKFETWTEQNAGTVNISALPQDHLSFMDRITLLEVEGIYNQVRQIVKSNNGTYFSFTTYAPKRVYEVYLYVNDSTPLEFVPVEKYTINGNKLVFDTAYIDAYRAEHNFAYSENVSASIRYLHNPTYYILDVNRDIIKLKEQNSGDERIMFPINCIGRKAHYVLNAPNFNGDKLFDNTNYNRQPINYAER